MKKFILLLASAMTFAQNAKPMPTILFTNKDKNLNGGCYRIPSLITAQDGTLIAVADQRLNGCGDLKYNDDINIVARRSTDGGKTWSDIESIVDFPKGESASDASMVLNKKTGDIILFYNYMDLKNEKDIFKQHYVISHDNGKTWSKSYDITRQIAPENSYKDFKFITSGRATQAPDGTIYQTLVDLQKKGVFIFYSKNNGVSWNLLTGSVQPADETNIVALPNGNILLNARVAGLGSRKIYEFAPNGKLLRDEVVKALPDPACNGAILDYQVGKQNLLFFSNANDSKKRKNMTIKYSTDNGNTWSQGKVLNPGFSAYSSLAQLDNNDLGILYEINDYGDIAFSYLPIDWVLSQSVK
ncbi:sialidase family protein [Ornithobacterium rhinotracheale]|uniref:sialidase family protein n=1 Tax=Ornithobacterium rhinotracheale TaxID=28251 RepID=UPI0040367694